MLSLLDLSNQKTGEAPTANTVLSVSTLVRAACSERELDERERFGLPNPQADEPVSSPLFWSYGGR